MNSSGSHLKSPKDSWTSQRIQRVREGAGSVGGVSASQTVGRASGAQRKQEVGSRKERHGSVCTPQTEREKSESRAKRSCEQNAAPSLVEQREEAQFICNEFISGEASLEQGSKKTNKKKKQKQKNPQLFVIGSGANASATRVRVKGQKSKDKGFHSGVNAVYRWLLPSEKLQNETSEDNLDTTQGQTGPAEARGSR